MNSLTKFAAVAACGLLVQMSAASADPAQSGKTTDACPSGMIAGPDGVCVKQKSGRMGFDLAAPSDDSAAPSPTATNTRGIKTSHHHHHS